MKRIGKMTSGSSTNYRKNFKIPPFTAKNITIHLKAALSTIFSLIPRSKSHKMGSKSLSLTKSHSTIQCTFMKRPQKKLMPITPSSWKLESKVKVRSSSMPRIERRNTNGFNLVAPAMSQILKLSFMEVSLQDSGSSEST